MWGVAAADHGRGGLVGPAAGGRAVPDSEPSVLAPAVQASRVLRALVATCRLEGVAGLGALPSSVVAGAAVPGLGARLFATRASRPGATQLAVVPTPATVSHGPITARPPRRAGP